MRYFSAKADVLVTRYGTGSYIGARVSVPTEGENAGKTVLVHNEDEVVAIPDAEYSKYIREYSRLVREGSLVIREESEFKAWVATEAKAAEQEAEDLKAAAKKDAEEREAAAEAAKKKAAEKAAADREAAAKKAEKEAAAKKVAAKPGDKS